MTNAEYKAKVSWLSRAFYLDKKITNLDKKIDFLRATAEGTCVKINPEPMGGGFDGSKMETKVISYVDLERVRDKCKKDLSTAQSEISQAISEVEDPAAFSVLVSRYLQYKSWDDINEILKTSFESRYVYRVHRQAVGMVNILNA